MEEVGGVKRRLWAAAVVAAIGIAEIVFAVQIRTWHGRDSWIGVPDHKIFVASWLASELWVDPVLLLLGAITLVLAVVLCVHSLGRAKREVDPVLN